MSPRPHFSVVGSGLLAITLLLSLLWVPFPFRSFLWIAIYNFAHVVLFALLAILLVIVSRHLFLHWPSQNGKHYAVASIGILILAVSSEMFQIFSSTRYPSVGDVLRDLIGGAYGLVWFVTVDRQCTGWSRWQQAPRNHLVRLGVFLLLLATLTPVIVWGNAYRHRAMQVPVLCQFTSGWEMLFVSTKGSDLQVVSPPSGWAKSPGDKVGRVVFHPVRYPSVRITQPYPEWRGFGYFAVDIFSELPEEHTIVLRIHDQQHNWQYEDRFNTAITVAPGFNRIRIPLNEIRNAPAGREMDLSAIQSVVFFAVSPSESFVLYFDNIRLGYDKEAFGENS